MVTAVGFTPAGCLVLGGQGVIYMFTFRLPLSAPKSGMSSRRLVSVRWLAVSLGV